MGYIVLNRYIKIREDKNGYSLYNIKEKKKYHLNKSGFSLLEKFLNKKIEEIRTQPYFLKFQQFLKELISNNIVSISQHPGIPIKKFPSEFPFWVEWLITAKCTHNYNCLHCCYSNLKTLKEIEDIKTVAEKLLEFGLYNIIISGGEPLIRKELPEIIQIFIENVIRVQVDTAGWKNGKIIKKIPNDDLVTIQVSLDGATAKTHNTLRRKVDSFDVAVRTIKSLIKEKYRVKVSTVLTTLNVYELEDMYNFLLGLNVRRWIIAPLRPFGNGLTNYKRLHPPIQLQFESIKKVIRANNELGNPMKIDIPYIIEDYKKLSKGFNINNFVCGSDRNNRGIHLLSDGNLVGCIYLLKETSLGNILEENPSQVIKRLKNLDLWRMRIKDLPLCKECKVVSFCQGGCRAVALSLSGSLLGCDQQSKEIYRWLDENE